MIDRSLLSDLDKLLEAKKKAAGPDLGSVKNFRYVVSAVNEEALKVWEDLWKELEAGVTPSGMVGSKLVQSFVPSCGWGQFLEKFWILKHYLDTTSHVCRESGEAER